MYDKNDIETYKFIFSVRDVWWFEMWSVYRFYVFNSWLYVFQTIISFSVFYRLLSKLLFKQSAGVENWFHSKALEEKIISVARTVCEESLRSCEEEEDHIHQGWDVLTLVLSSGIDRGKRKITGILFNGQVLHIKYDLLW